jgi:hypothetical protein
MCYLPARRVRSWADFCKLPNLNEDPDGGITLYFQHNSPGADKEANWPPAPDGPIGMVMRLYLPDQGGRPGNGWGLYFHGAPLTRAPLSEAWQGPPV